MGDSNKLVVQGWKKKRRLEQIVCASDGVVLIQKRRIFYIQT